MMMVDSGQPIYKSATMVVSASAVFYLLQIGAAMWFLWTPSPKLPAPPSPEDSKSMDLHVEA